jgi:hypothetical protein
VGENVGRKAVTRGETALARKVNAASLIC